MESKAKAVQLFLLAYAACHEGITLTIIGPTLPDLQCLFNVTIGEGASVFLVFGLAISGSSLISPFLIKMENIYILMASAVLIYSIGIGFIAVTPYIYVAWVGLFATGFGNGIYYVCVMVFISIFHKGETYAWHIIATAVSLGSFLGPLIAKPFIGITVSSTDIFSLQNLNHSLLANLSKNVPPYCTLTVSHVNVLYFMTGIIALPISFGLCLFYLLVKPKMDNMNGPNKDLCQIDTKGTSVIKTAYTFVVFLSFPMAYGLAFTYGSYLTTIGVDSSLNFGVQKSALMTSIFWLMFLIGRVTSTVLSNHIEQRTIMYICLSGQIISSGVLCVYETLGEIAFWIGSLALAFMSGPNYAGLVAWSGDYITHTPIICSIYNLMDNVGTSFLPYISGVLISIYGENAHVYFTFALCVLELVLFLTAHCLGTKLLKDMQDADSDKKHIINDDGKAYEALNDSADHNRNK